MDDRTFRLMARFCCGIRVQSVLDGRVGRVTMCDRDACMIGVQFGPNDPNGEFRQDVKSSCVNWVVCD